MIRREFVSFICFTWVVSQPPGRPIENDENGEETPIDILEVES